MQFLVTSDTLGKNIQGLSKMMNGKASLAILDHYLFEVDGNVLQVIASDGENMMRTTTELMESDLTPGESVRFCVHSRVLGDFLKNIPTQPLTIIMESKTEITINYMNGHVSFPCVSDDEYPTFDILTGDTETAILPSTAMLEDITRTSPFTEQGTMRPVLNAVCFNFKEDGLDVVSCNGQVLMKNHHLDIHTDKEGIFLLPPKPAALLRHFLCKEPLDICIKFTDSAAQFVGDTWQLTCRLIEGRYPNYNSVIPANNDKTMLIDKRALQDAIRRMLPMGNPHSKVMKMELDTTALTVSCEDIDYNTKAKESVLCDYDATPMAIGVNGDTLCNVLSNIPSDMVRFTFSEYSRPLLVSPVDETEELQITALLMPTLLND